MFVISLFRGMTKPVAAVAVPAAASDSASLSKKEWQVSWELVQSSYRKLFYGAGVDEAGVGEGGRATQCACHMAR